MTDRIPIVVFRADASVEIGTGHIMRCLTLADALTAEGYECRFICRELPGHMIETIEARGRIVHRLSVPPTPSAGLNLTSSLAHASWLGVPVQEDAAECRALLEPIRPDWIIVDHYALDAQWETAAIPRGARLIVIDDLADRQHYCDLLIDQNLGRKWSDYDGLVPDCCRRLIGPRYALLRSEFATYRAASLARRAQPSLGHILVTMGGVDKDNATGQVLTALADAPLPEQCRITVVMGSKAPWQDLVRNAVSKLALKIELRIDVVNMAELMTDADLAIGGAGTTSWERCCLGLPALTLVLAENQDTAGATLAQAGATMLLGAINSSEWQDKFIHALANLTKPAKLEYISKQAAALCDGQGAQRVCAVLKACQVWVRKAHDGDSRSIWEWRHWGNAVRYYRSGHSTLYARHREWFEMALQDRNRILLMICEDGSPIAHVRFDRQIDNEKIARIGICLSPERRGRGLAHTCLIAAIDYAKNEGIDHFQAEIHHENQSSIRAFERCGFVFQSQSDIFRNYTLS